MLQLAQLSCLRIVEGQDTRAYEFQALDEPRVRAGCEERDGGSARGVVAEDESVEEERRDEGAEVMVHAREVEEVGVGAWEGVGWVGWVVEGGCLVDVCEDEELELGGEGVEVCHWWWVGC